MRIHVFSDLHNEFGEVEVPEVECDCIVIAGDVSTKHHGLEWIRRRSPLIPVIYVCGNHEFYGDQIPRLSDRLREASRGTHVHFLEKDSVTLNGFHFFGCTLWSDLALHGDWVRGAEEANGVMNDFKRIRNSARGYRRLCAQDTRRLHLASLEAMRQFFLEHDPLQSVIVTHHAPSIRSLPEHRQADPVSCAYASNLDELIERYHPQLWIHGHIHQSSDYQVGTTRVIANPRAYPEEPNPAFIPGLIISI